MRKTAEKTQSDPGILRELQRFPSFISPMDCGEGSKSEIDNRTINCMDPSSGARIPFPGTSVRTDFSKHPFPSDVVMY